jgi:DNA-binding transcriptional LysR family regulator
MLFDPVDLELLVRLDDGQTQADIGSALHIDQSAVSKLLRGAEARSGLQLLEREGRRLTLSSAGRELARKGAIALRQLRALDDYAAALRAGRAGSVRVLASSTPGSYLLPAPIARFMRALPNSRVELDVTAMTGLWSAFAAGTHDFAVAPRMVYAGEVDAEPFCRDPIVLFAAPDSPIAVGGASDPAALADQTLVAKFAESYWNQVYRDLGRRGYAFSGTIDLRSSEAVKRTVECGIGVGMLFLSAVRREFEDGSLVRLPMSDPSFEQSYCILQRPGSVPTPLARRLIDFLRATFADGGSA